MALRGPTLRGPTLQGGGGAGWEEGGGSEETPTSILVGVEVPARKLNFKLLPPSFKFSFRAKLNFAPEFEVQFPGAN